MRLSSTSPPRLRVFATSLFGAVACASLAAGHPSIDDREPASAPSTEPAPSPIEEIESSGHFGAADQMRFNLLGGFAWDFQDSYWGQGGVGVSWFVIDSLSLDLELLGFGVSQDGPSAGGVNLNALVRWHFWQDDARRVSLYADAGGGIMVASDEVPAGGTSFNFTPQIGGGLSLDLGEDRRLMVGARWHHVSNAQTSRDNPGLDNLLLYVGLSIGF